MGQDTCHHPTLAQNLNGNRKKKEFTFSQRQQVSSVICTEDIIVKESCAMIRQGRGGYLRQKFVEWQLLEDK